MSVIPKSERLGFWRASIFWWLLWLLTWLPALVGCASKPWAAVKAGAASMTQRGPVAGPARAETVTSRATLPLPTGTKVEISGGGGTSQGGRTGVPSTLSVPPSLAVTLPAPAVLSVETVSERVSGPQSFAPPSPPSPVELAAGKAAWLYRVGLLLGIAAGVFGLVRGWDFVMYGGGAVAAACGFAMFAEAHPVVLVVIGIGAALAVVGPVLWHWKLKHVEPAAAEKTP